jgi:type VI secretion system secreted protein VgrG
VVGGASVGVTNFPVSPSPVAGNSVPSIAEKLGPEVGYYVKNSPTLNSSLTTLEKQGWKIKYGDPGSGSFCDKENKVIQIDGNEKEDPNEVATTLAHETGHALYKEDPYVAPDGLSKEEYVNANVESGLKDEGEATLHNIEISREIKKNTGKEIDVAGTQRDEYEEVYDAYKKDGDREAARKKIGDIFADRERPSTSPDMTYREYYSKPYEDYYDKYGGK